MSKRKRAKKKPLAPLSPTAQPTASRRRKWDWRWWAPVGLLLLCLLALLIYAWTPGETTPTAGPVLPSDPRLTYDGPYCNVHPRVRYVDDIACGDCHESHAKSYAAHPMGRSLAPVAKADQIERLGRNDGNPFERDGYFYHVRREGSRMVHRETRRNEHGELVSEAEAEVTHAIGAGRQARSYLFTRGEDFYFYSPITWFSQRGRFEISPAFRQTNSRFTLAVGRRCLFCHANRLEEPGLAGNQHRLIGLSIGCQRCHGPGELHVRRHEQGEKYTGRDYTIVNPAHLSTSLRNAVCQQCHLEGAVQVERRGLDRFDYRPGLPIHEFLATFIEPVSDRGEVQFVGHSEQMRISHCFTGSGGKLGCVSCHDPHYQPPKKDRVAYFRRRCLACHETRGCREPLAKRLMKSKQDDCTHCHMPARDAADIDHVAVTDHRVPRIPGASSRPAAKSPGKPGSRVPLLENFHAALLSKDDPEALRDRGIAHLEFAAKRRRQDRGRLLQFAAPLLKDAVGRDPMDLRAWDAYARTLWGLGRPGEAMAAYDAALAQQPRNETLLAGAGQLALATRLYKRAIELNQKATRLNPHHAQFRKHLGDAYLLSGRAAEALEAYRLVLRANPADLAARQGLADAYFNSRQFAQAQREYGAVLAHNANSAVAWQGLGDCHFALKQWPQAARAYEKVLAQDPNNPAVRRRVIECYRRQGKLH